MAGALITLSGCVKQATYLRYALLTGVISLCVACDQAADNTRLIIPERQESSYITDQLKLAGKTLFLWSEDSGCKLQITSGRGKQAEGSHWLKPMAPCYFIKSPGSHNVQVFRKDKTTRIIAVVGTPAKVSKNASAQRCGREVQGVVMNGHGKITFSERVVSGSVYCAESGLDNFQYSLF